MSNRQESESIFHNRKFEGAREKNYYTMGFTSIVFNNMMEKIGNIENKRILEMGCGEGWFTKLLASRGAHVWTFDISQEAVKLVRNRLSTFDFEHKVHVDRMAAEKLDYDDDMFELIIGIAILHHVDLCSCIKEIKRVLKKGGEAYFMEPLGHNPLLNLYRRLTPNLRSKDEAPMRFEQFSIIKDAFPYFKHEEYYLTAVFALSLHFLGMHKLMLKARDMLFKIDQRILPVFPGMRKYCWYSLLMIKK